MLPELEKVIGVHPGAVLGRELHARKMKKFRFAMDLQEHPQTITAITNGFRGINPALSIKLARALGLMPGHRESDDIDLFTDAAYGSADF